MIFDDFENILALFVTIVGLLSCLFKYIEIPRRGYLYLVVFFLSSFFSDYYWTIYTLVMHYNPNVSEFLAYLGWSVGYVFLLLAVLHIRKEGAKRYFHPVILWPVLTNACQFFIYIKYGGIFNNLCQVGITTAIMIVCMQELMYYFKNKKSGAAFPYLATLALLFTILEYGMWTSSCFFWNAGFLDPYLYCTVISSLILITFAWAMEKDYAAESEQAPGKSGAELRFQTIFQTVVSVVIFSSCAGGYIIALKIKDSMPETDVGSEASDSIVRVLFAISAILILFILFLLYEIKLHYKTASTKQQDMDEGRRSRFNFIFTIVITLGLMVFAVVYNSRILYDASVSGIYEDGKDVVITTATDLENYLTVAETTLRVAADTIDLMVQNGGSSQDILKYLTDQTRMQSEQFDENFTGIYAYVNGEYMDGSGWVPPEDYDPVSRDWYRTAVEANGEVMIVSPYVDAQTGSVVITVAKSIRDGKAADPNEFSVVCLDVIVNHIQEVTEQVDIAGKGFGMVVNADGFIVAHRESAYNGKNISDVYGSDILEKIVGTGNRSFDAVLNYEECTLFVHPIMDQWYAVIIVRDAELFESVHSQLAVNILVSLVTFWLISFFYYLGYKNEQNYGKKVEEMNMQVVGALAQAIDAKDTYTNGHSSRVAKYSRMIAARSGYSESRQDEIYMMGLLHDVGKIGVPDEVINKPSKLTDEEFEMIKKHPVIGSRILGSIKERPKLATGARWHHEGFSGGGYPDGIAGEEIPEEARIIAVADAYDAMTSRRSYRGVMPQEKVRSEIEKGSGTQFDPRFAKVMVSMIDEDKDYSMREK